MANPDPHPMLDERRLRLEEARVANESSFAKTWLPTLATVTVGLIAGMFSFVQSWDSSQQTERARIAMEEQRNREWGFKVVEMYFDKHELFDMTKNPEAAGRNLSVLAAIAPDEVSAALKTETARIPPPSGSGNTSRLESLAAVARVQDALSTAQRSGAAPEAGLVPSNFVVYVQYAAAGREFALRTQTALTKLGYRVPGIEQVEGKRVPPENLEVRYYRPEQEQFAGNLAKELARTLDLPAGYGKAELIKSSKRLPDGILEVWLPLQGQAPSTQ